MPQAHSDSSSCDSLSDNELRCKEIKTMDSNVDFHAAGGNATERRKWRRVKKATHPHNQAATNTGEEKPLSKIEERKIRNRQSAELSRKRKAEYLSGVEKRAKTLSTENDILRSRLKALEDENLRLRMIASGKLLKSPSSMERAKMGRDLIFESAALISLYYSIFSQQLEILAPLLQSHSQNLINSMKSHSTLTCNQMISTSTSTSASAHSHPPRTSTSPSLPELQMPPTSALNVMGSTSCLMSHFLMTVAILAMISSWSHSAAKKQQCTATRHATGGEKTARDMMPPPAPVPFKLSGPATAKKNAFSILFRNFAKKFVHT